ncbi:tyrosine-type recombinase/integrase [Halovenus sp. HT40]|uniref:tyrosine-type recombinase/integrase n=1 Tax=Halovenus sp. HT40 TaxID=3126691 RepID=UPI00300ECCCF
MSESDSQQYRVPDELAQKYLSVNEGVTLTAGTAGTYDSHLTNYNAFLSKRGQNILGAEFTDVLEFVESCVRDGNRRSTIEGKLTTVKELYCFIRLRTDKGESLQLDPLRFREINLDRYNTPEAIEREALSKQEIRHLFDAFNSYRNRLMAIVGVETGIRNSDIRGLRLNDVGDTSIHVHDPKYSHPYDVPISDQLSFELDWWIQNQRNGYAESENSDYVFPSQHGEKLKYNGSLSEIVREAAEVAGIQEVVARSPLTESHKDQLETNKEYREWHRVTVHTLRHSYITLLEKAGVSLPYRQLVANHSNPQTTKNYSHGSSEPVFSSIRESYNPPR